jgi:hypothetical protein
MSPLHWGSSSMTVVQHDTIRCTATAYRVATWTTWHHGGAHVMLMGARVDTAWKVIAWSTHNSRYVVSVAVDPGSL